MDVRFGRDKLLVSERSVLDRVLPAKRPYCVALKEFIGVAVQYGPLPEQRSGLSFAPFKALSSVSPLLQRDLVPNSPVDGVTLYLMHETRERDVLLYFADHEDEILAQWQFWSQKLALPKLMVGLDGFVDEPYDRRGGVIFTQPQPRAKQLGLYQRRSVFSRVRDVGGGGVRHTVRGREIMARH